MNNPSMQEVEAHVTEPLTHMNAEGMIKATLTAMREQPGITDEALMARLGLKRPASARFWKVKAQSLLDQEQQLEEYVPTEDSVAGCRDNRFDTGEKEEYKRHQAGKEAKTMQLVEKHVIEEK